MKRRRGDRDNLEDLDNLVNSLTAAGLKQRREIGMAILEHGAGAWPALTAALRGSSLEVRRMATFLLGSLRLPEPLDAERRATLIPLLTDPDAKVRKNASQALGKLQSREAAAALMDALDQEEMNWVRPSMVLALGAIGGADVLARLQGIEPRSPEEAEAVRKATGKMTPGPAIEWTGDPSWQSEAMELYTLPGLEDVLAGEFREKHGAGLRRSGEFLVKPAGIAAAVPELRTMTEFLFPAGTAAAPPADPAACGRAAAELANRSPFWSKLRSYLAVPAEGVPYRAALRMEGASRQEARAAIAAFVAAFDPAPVRFRNVLSNAAIEIRMVAGAGVLKVLVKPLCIPDSRFDYREADVGASINPVTAAALARMARGARPGRILDPFCGSATILIERLRLGGVTEAVGIDISPTAVRAANRNLAASSLQDACRIYRDDARNAAKYGRFEEVLANLPFGLRTTQHESTVDLYAEFLKALRSFTAPGSRIVLYAQEVSAMESLIRRHRWLRVRDRRRIHAGGLDPGAWTLEVVH